MGFNSKVTGGAQSAGQLLENGGLEWLYFADGIDVTSEQGSGQAISSFFNANEYPDIMDGRFLQLGHKVMHNYNRENTGEVADSRPPYAPFSGQPPIPSSPPVPGFWRGAFGPNVHDGQSTGIIVYRNSNKPGYELRMKVVGGNYGDQSILVEAEEFGPQGSAGTGARSGGRAKSSKAKKVSCPLWVGLGEADISVSGKAVQRLAARSPKAELRRYPYDHWQPCVGDAPAGIAADQIDFLRRHGLLGA